MDPSWAEYQLLLLQDNAPSHTAHRSVAALRESGIQEVPSFPSCSPDLNPIEGVLNLLKRRISQRQPRPTKYAELIQVIREEWDALEPDDYVTHFPRTLCPSTSLSPRSLAAQLSSSSVSSPATSEPPEACLCLSALLPV